MEGLNHADEQKEEDFDAESRVFAEASGWKISAFPVPEDYIVACGFSRNWSKNNFTHSFTYHKRIADSIILLLTITLLTPSAKTLCLAY